MTAWVPPHGDDTCEQVEAHNDHLAGELNMITEALIRRGFRPDGRGLPETIQDVLDGLHEWRCPNCGATTRARMADTTPMSDTT